LTAARLGAEVLVCEEHREIGVPKHCAGHLSVAGLERLGLRLPREVVENEIKGAVFHSPSGREFVVRRGSPVTCVVNRELFDKHLSDLAVKSGVRYFLESRVKSFLFDSGFVVGVAVKKGRDEKNLASNVVIDAEGCSSTLLRKAGLQTLRGSMVVRAIQAEVDRVDGIDGDMVEVYLGRRYAPGFFAWIIPKRDASAKVGFL
jgi:flavin-dependent dehydrogenase